MYITIERIHPNHLIQTRVIHQVSNLQATCIAKIQAEKSLDQTDPFASPRNLRICSEAPKTSRKGSHYIPYGFEVNSCNMEKPTAIGYMAAKDLKT